MSSTSPWASSATRRACETRGSPGMELRRRWARCARSPPAPQPSPSSSAEGPPHPPRSPGAEPRDGEATETGSTHPPTPARAPRHLPPLTPNSSLGQGLAPASGDPGGVLRAPLFPAAAVGAPAGLGPGSFPAPEPQPGLLSVGGGAVLSRAPCPRPALAAVPTLLGPGPAPRG